MPLVQSSIASQLKQTAATLAPSLWVRWRLMNRPRSAERELSLLKKIVAPADISVDVGANLGLYTRRLAGLSKRVHAFEPSPAMASLLRRTSARNVVVHETALSDGDGSAALRIPRAGDHLTHSLASLEPDAVADHDVLVAEVERKRLDTVVQDDVAFVKVDVEGHELSVVQGASGLIERCRPVFLVEVENRHRQNATASIFAFFEDHGYDGLFLRGNAVVDVGSFDPAVDQDESVLQSDGGRVEGRHYINNFFFVPHEQNGRRMLEG